MRAAVVQVAGLLTMAVGVAWATARPGVGLIVLGFGVVLMGIADERGR